MIKNCTPHKVSIYADDTILEFPSCGIVPRCEQHEELIGKIDNIQITKQIFGEVTDLPEQEDGVYLIVSRLVATACPNRSDLLIPGPLIRDAEGKIVGCKGLSKI